MHRPCSRTCSRRKIIRCSSSSLYKTETRPSGHAAAEHRTAETSAATAENLIPTDLGHAAAAASIPAISAATAAAKNHSNSTKKACIRRMLFSFILKAVP